MKSKLCTVMSVSFMKGVHIAPKRIVTAHTEKGVRENGIEGNCKGV